MSETDGRGARVQVHLTSMALPQRVHQRIDREALAEAMGAAIDIELRSGSGVVHLPGGQVEVPDGASAAEIAAAVAAHVRAMAASYGHEHSDARGAGRGPASTSTVAVRGGRS